MAHIQKSQQKYHRHMRGTMIEPVKLDGQMKVTDLVDLMGGTGFNARRLSEACELFGRMLKDDVAVGLTLSGAMTPIGMGGLITQLMEAGFIDWIISTGANLYHDLHRAFDYPVRQGHFFADDNELYDAGIARIYDVYIGEDTTLMATDKVIVEAFAGMKFKDTLSTADVHYILGKAVDKAAPSPDKSFLVQAMRMNVPVYTSSPGDSSIGMNLVHNWLKGKPVPVDPIRDVLETAAIVREAKRNGVLEVGGGSPKNFYLQTQPTLWQILEDSLGGHDYFIQITTDSPQWGGLSGATPSEARSWGKVKDAQRNNVVVYCDASIALPILATYALGKFKPRKRRELYKLKDGYLDRMKKRYAKGVGAEVPAPKKKR